MAFPFLVHDRRVQDERGAVDAFTLREEGTPRSTNPRLVTASGLHLNNFARKPQTSLEWTLWTFLGTVHARCLNQVNQLASAIQVSLLIIHAAQRSIPAARHLPFPLNTISFPRL